MQHASIALSNRLQEVGETDAVDSGRIPRTLEVHLLGDLVDDVTPGELVTITGVVKVETVELWSVDDDGGETVWEPKLFEIEFVFVVYRRE